MRLFAGPAELILLCHIKDYWSHSGTRPRHNVLLFASKNKALGLSIVFLCAMAR